MDAHALRGIFQAVIDENGPRDRSVDAVTFYRDCRDDQIHLLMICYGPGGKEYSVWDATAGTFVSETLFDEIALNEHRDELFKRMYGM
jgi:hypothetical protein